MAVTEKELEQARELVGKLEKECDTNSYLGVEIDSPFDNMARFDADYTIIDCVFQNIIDEIFTTTENLKYDGDLFGLTKIEAKSHVRTLKKFIKKYAKDYYTGNGLYEILKNTEDMSK